MACSSRVVHREAVRLGVAATIVGQLRGEEALHAPPQSTRPRHQGHGGVVGLVGVQMGQEDEHGEVRCYREDVD